jgi:predicted ATPase
MALDSRELRRPSPPGQGATFEPDGSNLPWIVADLDRKSPERHKEWVQHLQSALPDLVNVTTIERPEDRHRYLSVEYRGGLKVPSWMVSDGTLRLLALTLPAFIEGFNGIYLIEEPENGIHPLAIETMYQS